MVYRRRSYRRPFRRAYRKRSYGSKRPFYRKRQIKAYTKRITRSTIPTLMIADKTFAKIRKTYNISVSKPSGETYGETTVLGNGFNLTLDLPASLQVWAQFYQCFRIMSSSVVLIPYPADAYAQNNSFFGIIPIKSGLVFDPDRSNIQEQAYSKWRMGATLAAQSAPGQNMIKHVMHSKKMFGNKITQEEDYQGTMDYDRTFNQVAIGNPQSSWSWHIYLSASTTDAWTTYFTLQVTYYIRFEDRRPLDIVTEGSQ